MTTAQQEARTGRRAQLPPKPQDTIVWPRKTRELRNQFFDSTAWNDFAFRPDDIVIASYATAGTTWLQQIVAQLIFGGGNDIDVAGLSPWLDHSAQPKDEKLALLEAQTHRRLIKTHLPLDALVFSPQAKYLYAGHDGRDVVWSLYNHHANCTDEAYRRVNTTPGHVGPPFRPPPASIVQYFYEWLINDGHPFWPFWEHVASWWRIRHLPNVLLVHSTDLKNDLLGEIQRIAAFLETPLDDKLLALVPRHNGRAWHGGAQTFIHKGPNGRWRGALTAGDIDLYELIAEVRLGRPCARWLAAGRLAD